MSTTILEAGLSPARRLSRTRPARSWTVFGSPRIRRKHLSEFTRSLATLLDAGLPLVRALRTLERQSRDPLAKQLIGRMCDQIEGGSCLSDAMNDAGKTFDRLYVNMIRAGEASGALEQVLGELADYMERASAIRGKVKAALTYPLVVLIIALTITTALMIFIVPKFGQMFTEMLAGTPLPLLTRTVIAVSNFMVHHFFWGVLMVGAVVMLFRMVRKTRLGSYLLDLIAMKAPPFNDLVNKSQAARFCSTLSTLLSSGVSVLTALQITRDTCGNAVVAKAVQTVHDSVKEGEGIARPLEQTAVFPAMVVSMISVGEETGALPQMLDRIARNYENRVNLAVDALTSLIEPIMIVILGLMVGSIVLAMFLPLMVLVGNI